MNYFANIPVKFKNRFVRPADSDNEEEEEEDEETETPASDTEDDSGIAEEETQEVPHNFPDIQISDSLDTQTTALNNFFGYW